MGTIYFTSATSAIYIFVLCITAIYHGPVVSMDASVRMHSASHLDYGLIVVYRSRCVFKMFTAQDLQATFVQQNEQSSGLYANFSTYRFL